MENQTQLSIADLIELKEIVDVAASRGAFRANEMTSIGQVYDKLSGFLAEHTRQPEQPPNEAEQSNPQGE